MKLSFSPLRYYEVGRNRCRHKNESKLYYFSFKTFIVCTFECVYGVYSLETCIHVLVTVPRPGEDVSHLPSIFLLCSFETGSLIESGARLVASKLSQHWVTAVCSHFCCHMNAVDLNSGPHACTRSILTHLTISLALEAKLY